MIGAGVDYAVFLISRYHEYIRQGVDSDQAVARAMMAIGKVIAASAATVAVTFLGMSFTTLKVFSTAGPALAVSIAVAFLASITLLPAFLVLGGRRGWVKPKRELTKRFWRRSGVHIVRRPAAHLVGSLIILIPLAGCVLLMHTSYDARTALPSTAESNVGMAAIERHFPASITAPQYIFIQSPHDLRTTKALADLEQLAQRVSQLPDIATVRGVTRPTGEPLEQATLSYQAGEIGNKLADASSRIAQSTEDRASLTGGADKLADSLASVRSQLSQATGTLDDLSKSLEDVRTQFSNSSAFQEIEDMLAQQQQQAPGEPQPPGPPQPPGEQAAQGVANLNETAGLAGEVLDKLKVDPTCDPDPSCVALKERLTSLVDTLDKVQPSLDEAVKSLNELGLTNEGGQGGQGGRRLRTPRRSWIRAPPS